MDRSELESIMAKVEKEGAIFSKKIKPQYANYGVA